MDVLAFLEPPQEITLRTVALVALAPAYTPSLGARAVVVATRAAHPDSPAPGEPSNAAGAAAAYHRLVGQQCSSPEVCMLDTLHVWRFASADGAELTCGMSRL